MIIENIGSKVFKEVKYFKLNTFIDNRGYFKEVFNKEIQEFIGSNINFIQDNESCSKYGVLRGLHYQKEPKQQSKLVRVSKVKFKMSLLILGRVQLHMLKWESFDLSAENNNMLFVPKGFAHGFLVLSEEAIINYKVDNFFEPKLDAGIIYNDKQLDIKWNLPSKDIIISDKDKNLPSL